LKLINKVGGADRITPKLENEMLADIEWLSNLNRRKDSSFRYEDAYAFVRQKISSRYKKYNEIVKAECFYSRPAFYASSKNVEALKSFFSKQFRTPFENLCVQLSDKKMNDLIEYEAVQLAYQDKIDEAIAKMEKVPLDPEKNLRGNPFNQRLIDCHDCDHEAPQKIKYSKLSLFKKMKELKNKCNKGEDVFNNAMLLANAHYNITFYGNARIFYECKIIGSDMADPSDVDTSFRKKLIQMVVAKKYYQLAFSNAKTDEQKAKCQFMIAKCERNQWYTDKYYLVENSGVPGLDFSLMTGFKELIKYPNTQYYKDVIRECGYFRAYVSK